jgi:hypothetical protein
MANDRSNTGQRDALSGEGDDNESLRKSLVRLKRKVEEQNERIEALARGREKSLSVISELRAELALIANERDELRDQLTAVEGMQTETRTFEDSGIGAGPSVTPSIDALISNIGGSEDAPLSGISHSTARVDASLDSTDEWQEMLSPEMILLGSGKERVGGVARKMLVELGGSKSQWPIDQDLMTIGRSDSADIQLDKDFISRIHARVLRIGADTIIEDAGSRNGIRVNSERTDRSPLQHGDLVQIGSAKFRFVDTGIVDPG